MGTSETEAADLLVGKLLKVSEKEERALKGADLEELERCIRRKEDLLKDLFGGEPPGDRVKTIPGELVELLEKILTMHVQAAKGVTAMLGDCEKSILEAREGHRAHRAYCRPRKRKNGRSTQVL